MNRIRELRTERKLTQEDIGNLLNVSARSVGFYESGERDPDTKSLIKLANYFNVTVDYLIGESNDRGDGFEIHAHRDPNAHGMPLTDALDIVDKLDRLIKMRDAGDITQEEYDKLKKKLLK